MSTPVDLTRLREHAEATKSTSAARAVLDAAVAAEDGLSEGEHPDVLQDAADAVEDASAAYAAARAVERRAFIAYTNPFGVEKTTGMG